MEQKVWALVYGVDGFGADTAPALEEGIFLSKEKALEHCIELNLAQLKEDNCDVYEEGWGVDCWDEESEDGKILSQLVEDEDTYNPLFEEILDRHILSDKKGAELLALQEEPRLGYYCIRETFIR
jgi:hypothetical protein